MVATVTAQTSQYPMGISFKSLFMDYQSQNGGGITNFKDYHHGLEIGFLKNIQPNLNLVVPLKIGVVNRLAIEDSEALHKTVYGLDAQLQYQFWEPGKKVVPYVMAGLGAVGESEGEFNLQAPLGFGFQFMVADNAYINYQSEYRFSFAEDRNNLHHGLGFVYLFGNDAAVPKKDPLEGDKDGDGIIDEEDLCPEIAGLLKHSGCPDRDGDGVPDYQDKCADTFGRVELDGCPDTDGDGVADNIDDCPDVAGVAPTGCPEDPNTKDRDGDGVPDVKDGPVATGGCPEIKEEDRRTLDIAMRAVQFDTGRSTLKSESFDVLRQIADIMRRYPDYNLTVNGHTDNTGKASSNQQLSERRAKACWEYLTTQGISSGRMSFVGYGESRPIADNNTLRGRTLNRRVEFNLVPGR